MPQRELRPFLAMLPALQAREALQLATIVAYGNGRMKRNASDRLHRTWTRLAESPRKHRQRRQAPVRTPQEEVAVLRRLGINAALVPPPGAQEGT